MKNELTLIYYCVVNIFLFLRIVTLPTPITTISNFNFNTVLWIRIYKEKKIMCIEMCVEDPHLLLSQRCPYGSASIIIPKMSLWIRIYYYPKDVLMDPNLKTFKPRNAVL